jgi:hypothetical protein
MCLGKLWYFCSLDFRYQLSMLAPEDILPSNGTFANRGNWGSAGRGVARRLRAIGTNRGGTCQLPEWFKGSWSTSCKHGGIHGMAHRCVRAEKGSFASLSLRQKPMHPCARPERYFCFCGVNCGQGSPRRQILPPCASATLLSILPFHESSPR